MTRIASHRRERGRHRRSHKTRQTPESARGAGVVSLTRSIDLRKNIPPEPNARNVPRAILTATVRALSVLSRLPHAMQYETVYNIRSNTETGNPAKLPAGTTAGCACPGEHPAISVSPAPARQPARQVASRDGLASRSISVVAQPPLPAASLAASEPPQRSRAAVSSLPLCVARNAHAGTRRGPAAMIRNMIPSHGRLVNRNCTVFSEFVAIVTRCARTCRRRVPSANRASSRGVSGKASVSNAAPMLCGEERAKTTSTGIGGPTQCFIWRRLSRRRASGTQAPASRRAAFLAG